jgi:Uroporphyrinogen decarboxylase (URO-D)
MEAMNVKERFHASMNGEAVDRLPIMEWAVWWDQTVNRWKAEGLPTTDRYEMYDYFGLDMYRETACMAQTAATPLPTSHGGSIAASHEEYEKILPTLYKQFSFTEEELQWIEENKEGKNIFRFGMQGFFWYPRQLFGIEEHLFAFYDHPDLMKRMNEDLCNYLCRTLDYVLDHIEPDFITFAEDMSYNHGPMVSRKQYDKLILPYSKRVISKFAGTKTHTIIDSDGDITVPIQWFQDAGLDGALPLERQAGVDINLLQEQYPDFKYIGHFDKMIMHQGEAALRKEFERVIPAAKKGGFIISVDHQTPPEVSLEDYKLYIKLFKEYAVCR